MLLNKIHFQKILFISLIILSSLIFTNNANALSVGTASFDLHYKNDTEPWKWQNNILYGNGSGNAWINYVPLNSGFGYANLFQFNTSNFSAEGNYASLHFETNIVLKGVSETYLGEFVNLPYIKIQFCTGTGAFSNMQTLNKSISYATTVWGENNTRKTLTLYGDVSFRNIGSGFGKITCQIGNPSFSFISTQDAFSSVYLNLVYFEKNPISINFSNNVNDALLQNQINQNSTIINQNSTVIKNQNEIKGFLKDNSSPNVDTSKLPAVGILPAGPLDSLLGLPITIMTSISNSLSGSCQSVNLILPIIGGNLTLPCFDSVFYQGEFSILANLIGLAASAIILFNYLKHLYDKVDRAISLETSSDDTWGLL